MTKNEKALDALCFEKFGLGFFDLPELTMIGSISAAMAADSPVFGELIFGVIPCVLLSDPHNIKNKGEKTDD